MRKRLTNWYPNSKWALIVIIILIIILKLESVYNNLINKLFSL